MKKSGISPSLCRNDRLMGSIAILVECGSQNSYWVIPAEAGIQSTGSLWQRNRQFAHMRDKADFLAKTLKGTPSWKAWNHHRLVWLPAPILWIPVFTGMTAKSLAIHVNESLHCLEPSVSLPSNTTPPKLRLIRLMQDSLGPAYGMHTGMKPDPGGWGYPSDRRDDYI